MKPALVPGQGRKDEKEANSSLILPFITYHLDGGHYGEDIE